MSTIYWPLRASLLITVSESVWLNLTETKLWVGMVNPIIFDRFQFVGWTFAPMLIYCKISVLIKKKSNSIYVLQYPINICSTYLVLSFIVFCCFLLFLLFFVVFVVLVFVGHDNNINIPIFIHQKYGSTISCFNLKFPSFPSREQFRP